MAVGVAQAVDTPLESMQSRTMNPLSSTAFLVPAPGVLWPAPTEAQPPSQAFEGRLTGPSGRKRRKPQFDSRQNGGGGTKPARRRGHHGRKGAQYRKRNNNMPPAAPRNTNTSLLRAHGVPPTTGVAGKRSPSQTPPPDGTNRPATEAELAGIGDPFGTNVGVVTRDDFHDRLSDGGEGSFGMDDNEGSTRCSLDGGSWESGDEGDGQQEAQCSDEGERCEGEVEGERHEEYVKKLESDNETLRQRVEELEKRLQSSQKP